ncbi:MAG TPA: hypothetical protein QF572_05415 [Vicinamibacterales bacterium]|nr:hypothetical protein [Vicinamibacterales bacterium]
MVTDDLFPFFVTRVLPNALWLLGVGFLVVNLRLLARFIRFWRLRSTALLTWPRPRSRSYGISLAFGLVFGVLVFVKIVMQQRPATDAFGEMMMFIYYAYAFPLSLKIDPGFYDDGIWSNSGFVPYRHVGGLSWREGKALTLVLIHRVRRMARHLDVPQEHYGEVRRLLRDKIGAHDIHFTGKGFDLGSDEREMV